MHKFSANNLMTPDIVKHLHKQEPKGGAGNTALQGFPVATINTEFLKQGGKYYGKKH